MPGKSFHFSDEDIEVYRRKVTWGMAHTAQYNDRSPLLRRRALFKPVSASSLSVFHVDSKDDLILAFQMEKWRFKESHPLSPPSSS